MIKNVPLHHPPDFYKKLPKVELHRHLEGSVRLGTLMETGRLHGMNLPGTDKLRALVQVGENEKFTFENFLSKFQTLRLFYRSPQVIERITRETIMDAAADNIRYMELRFTPVALGRAEGFPLDEVIDWVAKATQDAAQEFGVKTRLIISLNRHESIEVAAEIAQLAADRLDKGIIGLDLAGNEAEFSAMGFLGIFKEARQAGLHVTIHAGEWGGATNVLDSILYLQAERIGHGVRVLEDPEVVALARERETPFEICVTSNYQSGVIPALTVHPLPRMISLGLNTTLNTDDPSISQITLSDEYRLVCEDLGLSLDVLRERILAAARAAFLSDKEKAELQQVIVENFPLEDIS
jgi:adenosine deaminase